MTPLTESAPMGRPRVRDPRTYVLRVRLTPTEAAEVRRLADRAGLPVADYVRAQVLP